MLFMITFHIVLAIPYVCLSARLFSAGIVSKRISHCFDTVVGTSFQFCPTAITKFHWEHCAVYHCTKTSRLILYLESRLPLRRPIWQEWSKKFFSTPSQWLDEWLFAGTVNGSLVADPSIQVPGFDLPRRLWCTLNHFRTGQGRCAASLTRCAGSRSQIQRVVTVVHHNKR